MQKNEGVVVFKSSYRVSMKDWEKHQPWLRLS